MLERIESLGRGVDERGPQHQILGRVADQHELGKDDEVGAMCGGLSPGAAHEREVARHVADDRIHLRERYREGSFRADCDIWMRVALRKALRNSVIVASRSDTLRDSTTNNEVDDGADLRRIKEMAMCLHPVPRRDPTHSAIRQHTTKFLMMTLILDRLEKWQSAFTTPRMLDVWSLVTARLARHVAFFAGSLFVLLPALASGQSTGVTATWDASPHSDQVSDYEVCIGTSSLSCNIHRVMVNQTSYAFAPPAGELVYVAVRANNYKGRGAYSTEHKFSIPSFTVPTNYSTVGQSRDRADQPECQ